MTAHINANPGDFASTVIMPGDPLRAKYIAETFLENVREVTNVRNMLGYTGEYQGKPLSVMGHGMGIPSMVLYAHELINEYAVKRIVRVGSLGATQPHIRIGDIILAQAAGTDSITNKKRSGGYEMALSASFPLLYQAYQQSQRLAIKGVHCGNVFSGDLYYDPDETLITRLKDFGVLGIDMEVAGLYGIAHQFNIEALAILTVSDHCLTGEETTAAERQLTFNNMIEIALHTVLASDNEG